MRGMMDLLLLIQMCDKGTLKQYCGAAVLLMILLIGSKEMAILLNR